MTDKLLGLYGKYREGILYIIFGGLTTVINYLTYIACFRWLPVTATTIPNIIAWVVAVLFAYLTNRALVFRSSARGASAVARELAAFGGARVATLLLETAILWLAVDKLGLPNLITKLAVNIIVIILNYLLSKFWIFTGGEKKE